MFRFSIRDVLWLTVIVGLTLGWWIDRTNCSRIWKSKTEFWRQCAIFFQSHLEHTGHEVDVGNERGFTITAPTGRTYYQTSETGREAIGLDPAEAWPAANELAGRAL